MKFRIFAFGLLVAFAACNSEAPAENEEAATEEVATEETVEEAPVMAANMDPVCGMKNDGSWEAYAIAHEDTTWFCSPVCKEAYVGNPEKYHNHDAEHADHDDHEGHGH